MRLKAIEVSNFRCFENLQLDIDGDSLLVIGANARGKSSLLEAIHHSIKGGQLSLEDFRDRDEPIELIATLSDLPAENQGLFRDAFNFNVAPPTLRVACRATWDSQEQELNTEHLFPDDGWRRIGREAREALPIIYLPAWRDPKRLTAPAGSSSLLGSLVETLPLEDELEEAVSAILRAGQRLSDSEPLSNLLVEVGDELIKLIARIPGGALSLGPVAREHSDVLRQLQLLLAVDGPSLPITAQSAGLAQAAIMAIALRVVAANPEALLLVDEPEIALHPQAQRAVVQGIREQSGQSLIATHSSAVLDRSDPRVVARLEGGDPETGTTVVRATGMSDTAARALIRYATSLSAEAYFAEAVIFVEGFSDLLALRTFAETLSVSLDSAGVSVISLEGADSLKHYLALMGPDGLDLEVSGLCDLDREDAWIARLQDAGINVTDRATFNQAGFEVSNPDLEAELLGSLSEQEVAAVFAADGAEGSFELFAQQPTNAGQATADLQLAFIKKDKIRWAPLLAASIPATAVPPPIAALLARV
jgi:predicted ATP-dependent endonuclease of OLD family